MYDVKWIRENRDLFDRGRERRGLEPLAAALLDLDERRRALTTKLQAAQERRNAASKEIGQAKAQKDEGRAQALMAEVAALKTDMPADDLALKAVEAELHARLSEIPNTPLAEVPTGSGEHDNVEVHRVGAPLTYSFEPKEHFELGEALGEMDFEAAAKMSGARFVVLKRGLARLERALGQYFLDKHTMEHGYIEVNPPLLVRDEAMFGTAQLPKFIDDQFKTERYTEAQVADFLSDHDSVSATKIQDRFRSILEQNAIAQRASDYFTEDDLKLRIQAALNDLMLQVEPQLSRASARKWEDLRKESRLWLIPTAEVSLTNLVREAITDEAELPLRLTALTPCFRAEAGSAGRDTRGMIRQHQFSKVEMVSVTTPEQSLAEHERMLGCAEAVLKGLGLHYRVVTLCTGDMGFSSQKTYDIEVWLPGQSRFREISSCSVCGDFQARRMNARYRPAGGGATRFVHTLNGSGVAVGRALVAVMETYQNQDGSITVPDVLLPYMGGIKRVERL